EDPGTTDPGTEDPGTVDPGPTDPGTDIGLPQIDGAFEFEATVRFDDIEAGGSQRVFEFGGNGEDSISFGQLGPSSAVYFEIVQGGATSYIVAEDALVDGETATWTVGVDETGFMYIEKDGVQIAEGDGMVPADTLRDSNLIGSSDNGALTPLLGEVSNVSITQGDTVWTDGGDGSVPTYSNTPQAALASFALTSGPDDSLLLEDAAAELLSESGSPDVYDHSDPDFFG
ncbi:hypothetical protein M4578_10840, partial [Salipiger sp. P9]|uniref:hypothetical protein n=1 Tax=Salipiger pentaromativorans TaxID=2943193 RepID=UPI002157CB8B